MMKGLKGKSAIVTGGTRGIGKAIASALLEEGVDVLITGRNEETAKKTIMELSERHAARINYICGDMKSENFCKSVVGRAVELYGKIDYLVNNAFPFTAKYTDAQRDDWLHVMESGPINYATMIAEYAKAHGLDTPGAVVNVSSISQYIAQPRRWTYNTAKGAVGQLTRCAAMDLAPNIRVNSISPACIWTDECTLNHDDPHFNKVHMIDRIIEPEECAYPVCFLLSDYASAITGTDLHVDGGFLAMGVEGWRPDKEFKGSN